MIPGKAIAGVVVAAIVISVSLALINEFQSMAEANGTLKADKKELKQSLKEAEAEKLDQANQITHLSELFLGVMNDRADAEKQADHWENEYNEAIANDDDCKKWNNTPLPACIGRMLNSGGQTGIPDKAGEGGSPGIPDRANVKPGN